MKTPASTGYFSFETQIRIVYGDTDKMGYCYYGNYSKFYEIGRTEMLRSLGFTYKELEEKGIMMPVVSLNIQYKKPAFYDELLTIKTIIREAPSSRIRFEYEIFNEQKQLINTGETILAFISAELKRPVAAPEYLHKAFSHRLFSTQCD